MRDAEPQRLRALEASGGQGEMAGLRHADAGGDERRDLGRDDADRGLAHGESPRPSVQIATSERRPARSPGDGVASTAATTTCGSRVDQSRGTCRSRRFQTAIGSFSPGLGLSP
jgi:hypothetical protein